MASKVIISFPAATSFQNIVQNNMERKDFLRMTSATDSNPTSGVAATTTTATTTTATIYTKDAFLRVNELEKTVTMLKAEQKCMLHSLHQEIASLQLKNRDLLCQLIFNNDKGFDFTNSINDIDVNYILTSQENKKPIYCNGEIREQSHSLNDTYDSKYTIDQQQREIDYLKGQLELVSIRNRTQNRESRQADNYIRDMEERNRDQDKLIRILRKENKEHKMEIESLRKILNNVRLNSHIPQNIQMPHVQAPQTQMFPPLGTPSTLWYQNRPLPLADYHQIHRNSISANGGDRSTGNLPTNVQFTLPPMSNYRQIAVTPPPPRFYNNTGGTTGCYYTTGQRPMVRSKTYTNENCVAARSPSKNITNTSND